MRGKKRVEEWMYFIKVFFLILLFFWFVVWFFNFIIIDIFYFFKLIYENYFKGK